MTYSDEYKVCWYTPQRTATRTTHVLLNALGFEALGAHFFNFPESRKDYYLISNIRNPYSRVVSLFSLYSIHKNEYTFNFNNWCEYALTDEKFDSEYQLRYEKKILSLNKKFDKFIRVEKLDEDLKSLSFIDIKNPKIEEIWRNNILNNRYTYEFKNIENNERKHWSNFYTERLADFVYENLKEQFELFDYNKDSWKNGTP
jgi:hypothetical protein